VSITSVTILLLDEEPLLRRATALLLERRGGQVTTAASTEEAAALCEERLYDVGILDVSPKGPSATETLQRLRAGGLPPRRVIAVTGAPLHRGEAERFAAVLQKPYRFEDLVRAVFGAGGRRRTRSGVFACEGAPPSASAARRLTPLTARARGAGQAERGRRG
jgi:CheY-like chemotaxis protein